MPSRLLTVSVDPVEKGQKGRIPMKASDISIAISYEAERQAAVAAAARRAASETASLNGPDKDFCELSYIVGSMREAAAAFDARA